MNNEIQRIADNARDAVLGAADPAALDAVRVRYLGKKGELTAILKSMGGLTPDERKAVGQAANEARAMLEEAISQKLSQLKEAELDAQLTSEVLDVTMPGTRRPVGKRHPNELVLDEIKEIFLGMGFDVVSGPEVEYDYYNFEALNIPKDHPARDTQDTFYISDNVLLRTQTSNMQVHAMETRPLPIRVLAPGRVYRKDEVDATHSPMFHQIEGLVVDKGVTMSDLKATLNLVVEKIYGKGTVTRFRPHHFPFTEPSCELDIQCHKCGGKGCPMCKGEGWIEVLGAGMVHPKVLAGCGIDPDVYSGWAFGMGLERLALGEYKINDMRLIFENDTRFLEQF